MAFDERLDVTSVAYFFGKKETTIYQWLKTKPEFPRQGDDKKWSAMEINAWAAKYHMPIRRR